MKRTILSFAAAILLASAGNTQAAFQGKKVRKTGSARRHGKEQRFPDDDSKPSVIAATTDPAYVIGPEDVIDINVWKEPDMTRIVPVRPDGKISLPLINDVQAAGSTPQQLASTVTEKLRKFLTEPASDRDRHGDQQPARLCGRRSASRRRVSSDSGDDGFAGARQRRRIHDLCRREKNPRHAAGRTASIRSCPSIIARS